MTQKSDDSIPSQEQGTAVDVDESVELNTEQEAQTFFQQVKERLFNTNNWQHYAGALSADFKLTDKDGNEVQRRPQEGDYFKINIPGPGILTGQGYDWVRVEEVLEDSTDTYESASIRVRPTSSPINSNPDVAHFYTDEATSNFIVKREGKKVTAGVYGRNEKPNVEAAENLLDKIRNAVVGTGGTTWFSKMQWKALVKGLLDVPATPAENT